MQEHVKLYCEAAEMQNDSDDLNPFPEPVEIEITDVFDLHTIPPRQVKAIVEEYLRESHRKGFPVVRIIHGKGRGVQREIVRSVLARTDFVLDWTDAPPEAGGLGATIIRLSPTSRICRFTGPTFWSKIWSCNPTRPTTK